MRAQRIAALAWAIISLVSGQSCPGVAAPRFGFATDPQYRAIKVAGGLTNPRGIIRDKAGRLLILQSGKGISQHIVNAAGCFTGNTTLLSLNTLNHGLYLSPDETKLFASTATTVYRWDYDSTTGKIGTASTTTIVKGMNPSGHTTRTLIISPKNPNLLVVSHGSLGNIDAASSNPATARAIVKVFNLNTIPASGYDYVTQGYNAGYGLRNEVGLAFDGQGMLWGVENSGDEFKRTVNGVTTDIHLNNPAEELNFLGDVTKPNNKWYGYPTCFTVGDPGQFKDAKFALGDQFVQAPTAAINDSYCSRSVAPRLTFPAHSAPLDAKFDSGFKNLFVTLHGAWNRSPPTGFSVVRVPFAKATDGSYAPVAARNQIGYVKVFTPKKSNGPTCSAQTCVRPVGLVFDAVGRLYMTSDTSGELFRIDKV